MQLLCENSSVLDQVELIQIESKRLEPDPVCLNLSSQNIAFLGMGGRFKVIVSNIQDMTLHLVQRHQKGRAGDSSGHHHPSGVSPHNRTTIRTHQKTYLTAPKKVYSILPAS